MESASTARENPVVAYARQLAGKKPARRALILCVAAYLVPKVVIFYLICGILDISRNKITPFILKLYFFGHGAFTWLLSPFNLLMDLLTSPYWNKGVYRLTDLPRAYQAEISTLLKTIDEGNLVEKLDAVLGDENREMMFFKWYGKNLETPLSVPEFHREYKYIRTIGVSVFNRKRSTNKHFGPFRITLRVLYNFGPIPSDDTYIEVRDKKYHWKDNRLFIFDDTLLHQSINETDARRYCAFIDILRPSLIPWLLSPMARFFGALFLRVNHLFYKGWTFIK
jgi:aspartyl/asparaginyl beta-hydroxylase (cupin superfamily)